MRATFRGMTVHGTVLAALLALAPAAAGGTEKAAERGADKGERAFEAPVRAADADAATPRPAEAAPPAAGPKAEPPAAPSAGDLSRIAAAVDEARARAALVAQKVFRARLVVWLRADVDDDLEAKDLYLLLDGDPVFAGDAPHRAAGWVKVFDGWVAPGRHAVTARLSFVDARERGAAARAFAFEAAGGTTVIAARDRAAIVRFDAEADGALPSADDEAEAKADGEFESSVEASFELVPLAEGDEAP